jgi:hypothetical protein
MTNQADGVGIVIQAFRSNDDYPVDNVTPSRATVNSCYHGGFSARRQREGATLRVGQNLSIDFLAASTLGMKTRKPFAIDDHEMLGHVGAHAVRDQQKNFYLLWTDALGPYRPTDSLPSTRCMPSLGWRTSAAWQPPLLICDRLRSVHDRCDFRAAHPVPS